MSLEERIAELERQVAELQAREGVRLAMARYARSLDEDRFDELDAVFTEDAVVQAIPWNKQPIEGKAKVLKGFRNYRNTFHHPRRYVADEQIQVHGDTASAYTYWFVTQGYEGQSWFGSGTYEWGFRRVGADWKVSRLIVRIETMTTLEQGWGAAEGPIVPLPRRS